MAIDSVFPTMAAGVFFGDPRHTATTPSFQFCELTATVPEPQVPRHTHNVPHFILITGGEYVTEARRQKGICSTGTLIFNPAGTTHRDRFRSDRGSFLSISPGKGIMRCLEAASPVPLIVEGKELSAIGHSPLADRIVGELRQRLPCSTMALEGLGLELAGLLAVAEERSLARVPPRWLMQVKERIEDCAATDLSIAELADGAEVHPVYLARAYRQYFASSPGEYLRRCRLLRVQALLSGSDLPLVQIALQCGFSDQSQMTRSFSTAFGIPPARYRRLRK